MSWMARSTCRIVFDRTENWILVTTLIVFDLRSKSDMTMMLLDLYNGLHPTILSCFDSRRAREHFSNVAR